MDTPTRETSFQRVLNIAPLAPPFIVMAPADAKFHGVMEVKAQDGNPHPALIVELDPRMPAVKHTFTVLGLGHAIPDYCETFMGHVVMEGKYFLAIYKDKEDAFEQKSH